MERHFFNVEGSRLQRMSDQENSNVLLHLHDELKVWFDSCVLGYWNVSLQVEVTVLSGLKLYALLLFSAKAA